MRQFFAAKKCEHFYCFPTKTYFVVLFRSASERHNIRCGYSFEVPHRGTSNEYPQHMFLWRNEKTIMWIPLLSEVMIRWMGISTRTWKASHHWYIFQRLSWHWSPKQPVFIWHPTIFTVSFCWFKKGSCQPLAKECAQILVNCLED